jgi:hypothetical protein
MSDLSKLVKPLVWRGCGDTDGVPEWEANSLIGQYSVRYVIPLTAYHVYGGWVSPLPLRYRDDDLAKAAAQADYTARVISALDPEALAKIRADALREAAERAQNRWAIRKEHAAALYEMDYPEASIDSKTVSAKGDEAESIANEILALIDKEDQA